MKTRATTAMALLGLFSLVGLTGCENDCQQMCREFADIYEECGVSYGDAELSDCLAEYRIPDQTLLDTVCAYGMRPPPGGDHTSTIRADMAASSEDGDICETLEGWKQAVGGE
jgi:hypothetical protein